MGDQKLEFNKQDLVNLHVLMSRAQLNGLSEAETAVVLSAKLKKAIKAFDEPAKKHEEKEPTVTTVSE